MEADPVVTAFDFVNFYPNMDAEQAAQDAHDAVMETETTFTNINYKEAVKYIAANLTEEQANTSDLRRVLPCRANTGGKRPKCTGPEAVGPSANGEKLWECKKVELTALEKKKIIAKVVQISVKTMFKTHLYQFGGKVFHQQVDL